MIIIYMILILSVVCSSVVWIQARRRYRRLIWEERKRNLGWL